MASTSIARNSAQAVKRWSTELARATSSESYFQSRFIGRGQNAKTPIQSLTELESDAGEQISYDLLMPLKMAPVEGDDKLESKEEKLRFYTDTIYVDQARSGASAGGRMVRKRVPHDLRERAKQQMAEWWARLQDELMFIYLSGARGISETILLPLDYTGRAGNALKDPSASHHLFGGNATAFNNIDSTDTMSTDLIDKAVTKAKTQGGGASDIPRMQPCRINGSDQFVLVMHPFQETDMRSSTSASGWLEIQKAAAGADGRNSPMFKDSMGMYRGVILHAHENVIRFNTAGSGANVEAARALFMGAQAGVIAYGSPGTGMRYTWHEETKDHGNETVISSACIFANKKTRYTIDGIEYDFGLFALDTAAAE